MAGKSSLTAKRRPKPGTSVSRWGERGMGGRGRRRLVFELESDSTNRRETLQASQFARGAIEAEVQIEDASARGAAAGCVTVTQDHAVALFALFGGFAEQGVQRLRRGAGGERLLFGEREPGFDRAL